VRLSNILLLVAVLVVAVTVFLVTRPVEETTETPDPKERIWQFDMDELKHIIIELPPLEMSESFVKHEDRQWYFDEGTPVNTDRWGGGIPAILSGPTVERRIEQDATEERLEDFGLNSPMMILTLTKEDGEIVRIEVGDEIPVSRDHYIKLAESNDVYTINSSWYDVLENLVLDPPYPPEEEE
jgi:hypothetical protein